MNNQQDIHDLLILHEGKRLKPYIDTVGKLTVGVGRNLFSVGISDDECMLMLDNDISRSIEDVRFLFSCYDSLDRPRQLVLISMAFNLGRLRLSKFVRFIWAVHQKDYDTAAQEMRDSRWYEQVGHRGEQLARTMQSGEPEWV